MADSTSELMQVYLEDEMRQSYLDYSMSVIVGRALPDIRDGLKPVHRRALFAMRELKNDYNKPYKKAARIVGDIIGKYHPHGDSAVYDALVRMVQPFSLRYPLVDGQGNFGSVDGDAPAAMRYTEVRMTKMAHDLLIDLDKETVDFQENYDGSEHEPTVLPTRVPNLLINGSSGIAVGMATNIPPHNLREVVAATLAVLDNPDITTEELIEHIPGPDFPTAGLIIGRKGIRDAYTRGRGSITMRARAHIESGDTAAAQIIVTELPYRVNKALLLENIAKQVKQGTLTDISNLRDESDKDGMRMVVVVKQGANAEVVLNNLYKKTLLQANFGFNFVALSGGRPQLVNLKQSLEAFIGHRREVVTRRTIFELRKAREKAHILESLAVALANIDAVVALIKSSVTPADAKQKLQEHPWSPGAVTGMLSRTGDDGAGEPAVALTRSPELPQHLGLHDDGYYLSPGQAQAILDLRLHRLTALEQDKITKDYEMLVAEIADSLMILSNPDRMLSVIREELEGVRDAYEDDRRTEILEDEGELMDEDLIPPEDVIGTFSNKGYAKIQSLESFDVQGKGGIGKKAAATGDDDFIRDLFTANTHDELLCFSNRGKVYQTKVYRLPRQSRTARGLPLVNIFPLNKDEKITAVLPMNEWSGDKSVLMATRGGKVKKTPLKAYFNINKSGKIAVKLAGDDELIGVGLVGRGDHVMLFGSHGKVVHFSESQVRNMGRTAAGVRGMKLPKDGQVKVMLCMDERRLAEEQILIATANGYGKRTACNLFPRKNRNTKGVIAIKVNERNGQLVKALPVKDAEDEVLLISSKGTMIRISMENVLHKGRNTQGVRLVKLREGTTLTDMVHVHESQNESQQGDRQDTRQGAQHEPQADDVSDDATE